MRAFHRGFDHSNLTTNGSIEGYHQKIKARLFSDKQRVDYRRMDWLLYKLLEEVHSFYFVKQAQKKAGIVSNLKAEKAMLQVIGRAINIPDFHISHGDQDAAFQVRQLAQSCRLCERPSCDGNPFTLQIDMG